MKRSKGLLGFVGGCLLFLGLVGAANATTGESSYLWTGIVDGTISVTNMYKTPSSFGIYSWENKAASMPLFTSLDTNYLRTLSVFVETNKTGVDSTKTFKVGRSYGTTTDTLMLGSTSQFGFYFTDSNGISNTYALSGNASAGWDLSHGGMDIHITGDVTPTPTPIPGAVLLFGSSLLGLLGIGNRKNKA